MRFHILTLFPDFFTEALSYGVLGAALKKKLIEVQTINIRDFTEDLHQSVDDRPFGGGDGMVMSYRPLKKALSSLKNRGKVIYLSPQGAKWNQKKAKSFVEENPVLTLICGRYSGVDARFIQDCADEEISIGDYILSGGEGPALILMDSLSRLVPGVLGNPLSPLQESFEAQGLLEAPQWTRPRKLKGFQIPEVFFSGRHKDIEKARFYLSLIITSKKRPDIIKKMGKNFSKDLNLAQKWWEALSSEEKKACGLKPSLFFEESSFNS